MQHKQAHKSVDRNCMLIPHLPDLEKMFLRRSLRGLELVRLLEDQSRPDEVDIKQDDIENGDT